MQVRHPHSLLTRNIAEFATEAVYRCLTVPHSCSPSDIAGPWLLKYWQVLSCCRAHAWSGWSCHFCNVAPCVEPLHFLQGPKRREVKKRTLFNWTKQDKTCKFLRKSSFSKLNTTYVPSLCQFDVWMLAEGKNLQRVTIVDAST